MKFFELKPKFDSRKSFYGKAQVVFENGAKNLYSYNTKVATIKNGKAKVIKTHSTTTTRHIKDFLKQNNFNVNTKKDLEKKYLGKWGV